MLTCACSCLSSPLSLSAVSLAAMPSSRKLLLVHCSCALLRAYSSRSCATRVGPVMSDAAVELSCGDQLMEQSQGCHGDPGCTVLHATRRVIGFRLASSCCCACPPHLLALCALCLQRALHVLQLLCQPCAQLLRSRRLLLGSLQLRRCWCRSTAGPAADLQRSWLLPKLVS